MPTLLSLFDGSGGFPLAGTLCGITPKYASEVEPYPIAVTRSRFPDMIHLGDVSRVHGWDIEPVDVVTFGSPCQDMSIAGKRAGIKNESVGDDETTRSGLFHEAARIIREMREETNGLYPRFAVWENVPGAFSSNKGEDFRCVLETLIQIVEPCATMPPVPKGGWPYADCYVGDGWSIAYRTFDAQYWGVPQRRRRIYLVLDLTGQRAGKILFKRPGLRGYFETGGTQGQGTAADAPGGSGTGDCWPQIANTLTARFDGSPQPEKGNGSGIVALRLDNTSATPYFGEIAPTLTTGTGHGGTSNVAVCTVQSAAFKAGQGAQARSIGWEMEKAPTLAAEAGGNSVPSVCVKEQYLFENHSQDTRYKGPMSVCPVLPAQLGTGGNNTPFVVEKHEKVICIQGAVIGRSDTAGPMGPGYRIDGKAYTLDTKAPSVICMATQQGGAEIAENLCPTITAAAGMSGNNQPVLCMAHGPANAEICENCSPCLNCNHEQPIVFDKEVYNSGSGSSGGHYISEGGPAPSLRTKHPPGVCIRYIVRRLTPTECCRLQGFPDGWGEIDAKEILDPEEDFFWLEVRQTFDKINGRPIKDYTAKQIRDWYNKLQTDSAEYKMWGNGIALPNALYVMQGVAEAMFREDTTTYHTEEEKTRCGHLKNI